MINTNVDAVTWLTVFEDAEVQRVIIKVASKKIDAVCKGRWVLMPQYSGITATGDNCYHVMVCWFAEALPLQPFFVTVIVRNPQNPQGDGPFMFDSVD